MGSIAAASWLEISEDSHFSLANVPFGICSAAAGPNVQDKFVATRLGDYVVNLGLLERHGLLEDAFGKANTTYFVQPYLNAFAALPGQTRRTVRKAIQSLFSSNGPSKLRDDDDLRSKAIYKTSDVTSHLPFQIPDYIDYSVFPDHGRGAGRAIFGPETKLPPSFACLPMAYNGRSGTVSINEQVTRPQGQCRAFSAEREVSVGPCQALDWEFEIGAFVSNPTEADTYLTPAQAGSHIFGYVILNDWSARDVQGFEMVPLGPFNGKSFATTISPWVVTRDALEEFAAPLPARMTDMPYPEPEYLAEENGAKPNFDINCKTTYHLASTPSEGHVISRSSFAAAYWSFNQLIAFQTYNGAAIRTGDLLGSGTISNEPDDSRGCILEMASGGKVPVKIGNEERRWLQDGDEVVLTAWAGQKGQMVGFGELRGKINPAKLLRKASE